MSRNSSSAQDERPPPVFGNVRASVGINYVKSTEIAYLINYLHNAHRLSLLLRNGTVTSRNDVTVLHLCELQIQRFTLRMQ